MFTHELSDITFFQADPLISLENAPPPRYRWYYLESVDQEQEDTIQTQRLLE